MDHELVWFLVSLGGFLGLMVWFAARLPTPGCPFRSLTGLPCLTCGATRSAYQFLHGHFAASFLFNPLAFVTYCGLIIFDIYAFVVLITGSPRFRLVKFSHAEKLLLRWAAVLLLASNWIYLLTARPF
jgi:hypothetical protein